MDAISVGFIYTKGVLECVNGPKIQTSSMEFSPNRLGIKVTGTLLGSTRPIEFAGYIYHEKGEFTLSFDRMARVCRGHRIILEDDGENLIVTIDDSKVEIPFSGELIEKIDSFHEECDSPGKVDEDEIYEIASQLGCDPNTVRVRVAMPSARYGHAPYPECLNTWWWEQFLQLVPSDD